MKIRLPDPCLVVLIGPSGSGKSSFARKHFAPFETVSSDFCRGLVANDENAQHATDDAFDLLHDIARTRLRRGLLTVVDATNVQKADRAHYIRLAREFHVLPVAIVLSLPTRVCLARNAERHDRQFGPHVVVNQHRALKKDLRGMEREGFRHLTILRDEAEVDGVTFDRQPLWANRGHEHGPFDIIGDVHGCYTELHELIEKLGYAVGDDYAVTPPEGRRLFFVGDLVDRGPDSPGVLRLVMRAVRDGHALCVPGNHDVKLLRALRGRKVRLTYGLDVTMAQLESETDDFRNEVARFIDDLVSHAVVDDGKLVVAHAGMKESMQGRASGAVREFALYGETTGETDEFGLPVRVNWAEDYRGRARVVYGHTPVPEPQRLNGTINIDTGCVFGGKLTALRYPEDELVSVPAREVYCEPTRPIQPMPDAAAELSAQQLHDDLLNIDDVFGKRGIPTALRGRITIREANAAPALEVMSRFAADPRWLIYLPPTMSPCETSNRDGLLEHPAEAFADYASVGVREVVIEEKHMGSRSVVVLTRSDDVAVSRFGLPAPAAGVIVSRTGRPFFRDADRERELLLRLREAFETAGAWEELETDWILLDAELMPWSEKARELLTSQYAPVGVAANRTLTLAAAVAQEAAARFAAMDASNPVTSESVAAIDSLLGATNERLEAVRHYRDAWRPYCWSVDSINDLKLAPFHLLATEGRVHTDRDHVWHMETLREIARRAECPNLMATCWRVVPLDDEAAIAGATAWWEEHTANGGEGMVVKPRQFIARSPKEALLQPAMKVRGREYLRIIYGPEYTRAENLKRLRARKLGHKRSMALREFALGVEAMERFVRGEPLRRVHECVLGVLALESEPADPRL